MKRRFKTGDVVVVNTSSFKTDLIGKEVTIERVRGSREFPYVAVGGQIFSEGELDGLADAEVPEQSKLSLRLQNDFTYHRPPEAAAPVFTALREKAKELALMISESVPSGREQQTALTRLEEAVFHANAGIARQFPVEPVKRV